MSGINTALYDNGKGIVKLKAIVGNKNTNIGDCIEISYNKSLLENSGREPLFITIEKMSKEILRYYLEQSENLFNGTFKLKDSNLRLPDCTNLFGEFEVCLKTVRVDEEVTIAKAKLNTEPKRSVYKGTNDFSNIVGTNYTNTSAVNQIQMWLEFRSEEVDREFGYAEDIGLNAMRVFLHMYPFENNKIAFLDNLERYLNIANKHGIRTIFVFFDDCWYGDDRVFTFEPIKGRHNGRWAKCPLTKDRIVDNYPRFRVYIQEIIGQYKDDDRILAWEIWNEPKNCGTEKQPVDKDFTQDLMVNGFSWAREMHPKQPVISCWDGNKYSDVDDQHNYSRPDDYGKASLRVVVDEKRGTLVTEAGARSWGKECDSYGSPIEIIHWLKELKEKNKPRPGVFLTWELMVGNSNCRWHWSSKEGDAEPPVPWSGLFYPDGNPVSLAEAEAIRSYTKEEVRSLFYCDFQDGKIDYWTVKEGLWYIATYGNTRQLVAEAGKGDKIITAGDNAWTDYCVQSIIILAHCKEQGAGIIFRTSASGSDGINSYYCGFTTGEIFLHKIIDGKIIELKSISISGIQLNVRNSIKVCAKNNKIRIYLNNPCNPVIDYMITKRPFYQVR